MKDKVTTPPVGMKAGETLPEVLTIAEVASYLRVSEATIWRWCSTGKLRAFRIGRGWRIRRSDLYLQIEQEASPSADPPVDAQSSS